MFGHNSFDSPQPLVFATPLPAPRTLYGVIPQFFEFCDNGIYDLTTSGWFIEGKQVKSFNGKKLGSYWIPHGWVFTFRDKDRGLLYTDSAIKEGKQKCVPAHRDIWFIDTEYVGFCEDSNRKSLKEGLVGDVMTDGKSYRDMENVCGECVEGYEENDGKCVESQSDDDENGETEPQEDTNWPLLMGGITVLGLGAYFLLNK